MGGGQNGHMLQIHQESLPKQPLIIITFNCFRIKLLITLIRSVSSPDLASREVFCKRLETGGQRPWAQGSRRVYHACQQTLVSFVPLEGPRSIGR